MRRVVVTGMGIVSPLGVGVKHSWDRLIRGESGIGPLTLFELEALPVKIAGEVPRSQEKNAAAQGKLNIDDWIDPKDARKIEDFIRLAVVATAEALKDANWFPTEQEDLEQTGVLIGAGIGGINGMANAAATLYEKGPRRVNPFFIPSSLINLASGFISIKYGFQGPNHSVVTACATGTHSIGDASRLIMHGDADVMVAGGTEAALCPLGMVGFTAMRALSTKFNDRPTEASRPWDEERDGFVMGEGSGVLILEELEHAKKRGAHIYAELVGYGLSGDAYHITSTIEDGRGGYRAMRGALRNAQINPEQLDYVNAHGTSTPIGDPSELHALRRLMGPHLHQVSMSSTKSSIGHLLGAAGGVEAVFTLMAMQNNIAPPTLNLHNPIQEAEGMDLVPLKAKELPISVAMSNSFGFGGTNASVVFREFKG